ncbi:hypothetical protein LXA47_06185 [Massilia sp. P8910]|nr:hypothetical protein [Massilia antarctica]
MRLAAATNSARCARRAATGAFDAAHAAARRAQVRRMPPVLPACARRQRRAAHSAFRYGMSALAAHARPQFQGSVESTRAAAPRAVAPRRA